MTLRNQIVEYNTISIFAGTFAHRTIDEIYNIYVYMEYNIYFIDIHRHR
jgi:hypothetical protein